MVIDLNEDELELLEHVLLVHAEKLKAESDELMELRRTAAFESDADAYGRGAWGRRDEAELARALVARLQHA